MPLRFYRRKTLGRGVWLGAGKSGLTLGRRGRRVSASINRRGIGGSLRLARGLSYMFKRP